MPTRFAQTWTLANYSHASSAHYSFVLSDSFCDQDKLSACLELCPHGHDALCRQYVSLYVNLECLDDVPIRIKCEVSILDTNGQKQNTKGLIANEICYLTKILMSWVLFKHL